MNRIDLPKRASLLGFSLALPNGRSCSNQSTNLNLLTPPDLHPTLNPQPQPTGDLQCPIDDSRVSTASGITPGHNSSIFPKLRWLKRRLRWLSPDIRMFLLLPLRIRWIWGRICFSVFGKNGRLSVYVPHLDICYLFKVIFARHDV